MGAGINAFLSHFWASVALVVGLAVIVSAHIKGPKAVGNIKILDPQGEVARLVKQPQSWMITYVLLAMFSVLTLAVLWRFRESFFPSHRTTVHVTLGYHAQIEISNVEFGSVAKEVLPFNIYLANKGGLAATGLKREYVVGEFPRVLSYEETHKAFSRMTDAASKDPSPGDRNEFQPGDIGMWFTGYLHGITKKKEKQITAGTRFVYLMVLVRYLDVRPDPLRC